MRYRIGSVQKKILLLLLTSGTLLLTHSPRTYYRALGLVPKAWKEIDRESLRKAIEALDRSKLVDIRDRSDGTTVMTLSENGRKRALLYNFDTMSIPQPKRWDGRWRLVLFDIPEKKKKARDALRFKLRQLGFHELQKSVFVHPYPCHNEIEFLIEMYMLRRHVCTAELVAVSHEPLLKQKFHLR